jgi:hypothetical protein
MTLGRVAWHVALLLEAIAGGVFFAFAAARTRNTKARCWP